MSNRNPLRYRGYYYDTETGFYYLQSRYYDPALGRFINADSYASTGQGFLGYNMFAYCKNSPTTTVDFSGHYCVCIAVNDGGGGGHSSKNDKKGTIVSYVKETIHKFTPEELFQTYYTKTYGVPYTCPTAHQITVSYYIGGRTKMERTADVGALGGVGYFVGKYATKAVLKLIPGVRWASLAVDAVGLTTSIVSAIVADYTVKDTDEKRIFRVDEWVVYNGKRRGIIQDYEVSDQGYLTLIYRAYYRPNPNYNSAWDWDAKGSHWN